MKNASYCVSYGKEGRLQQNEQKNSFCYSPFFAVSRQQLAVRSDSDAAARRQIQTDNIASSNPQLVKTPRPGPA